MTTICPSKLAAGVTRTVIPDTDTVPDPSGETDGEPGMVMGFPVSANGFVTYGARSTLVVSPERPSEMSTSRVVGKGRVEELTDSGTEAETGSVEPSVTVTSTEPVVPTAASAGADTSIDPPSPVTEKGPVVSPTEYWRFP